MTLVDTERGIFIPKHRRRVGYVFQEGRLFPHLTVRQNLLFGRWFAPRGGAQRRTRRGHRSSRHRAPPRSPSERALRRREAARRDRTRAAHLARASCSWTSRSLRSTTPRKAEILPFIERLRDEAQIPIVYVSHSLAEVARLATTVVVLDDGKVAAAGSPEDVLGRTDLVAAGALGDAVAVIKATVSHHDEAFGLTALQSPAGTLQAPLVKLAVGTFVRVRVEARDVLLATEPPHGLSALNVLRGRVVRLRTAGPHAVDIDLDCNGERIAARLTRKSVDRLALRPGLEVYAVIKSIALGRDTVDRAPASTADAASTPMAGKA